jgi:putative phosphoribosyl transferase
METRSTDHDELSVAIDVGGTRLEGDLVIPADARGLVLFAHGSGSSRFSPRNRFVAEQLQQSGLATLLIDLLTRREESLDQYTAHLRFDIRFLAERLVQATEWATTEPRTSELSLGYFGASTGAAAALVAAAHRPDAVSAVVSRGGRPDLAEDDLASVRAPTLLIVGSRDEPVIEMNEEAFRRLGWTKELRIVQGASHLFEEPGTLEQVATLAADWFARHLVEEAALSRAK